jgi:hypothetical protein
MLTSFFSKASKYKNKNKKTKIKNIWTRVSKIHKKKIKN